MSRQNHYIDLNELYELTKTYLRVDHDDDRSLIEMMIKAAREYVVDAIGYCDETISRVMLLEMVILSEMYEKRTLTVDSDSGNKKVQYSVRSIINQLQAGDDEDE